MKCFSSQSFTLFELKAEVRRQDFTEMCTSIVMRLLCTCYPHSASLHPGVQWTSIPSRGEQENNKALHFMETILIYVHLLSQYTLHNYRFGISLLCIRWLPSVTKHQSIVFIKFRDQLQFPAFQSQKSSTSWNQTRQRNLTRSVGCFSRTQLTKRGPSLWQGTTLSQPKDNCTICRP